MAELIVALDVQSREEAVEKVKLIGEPVGFYKIGLELFFRSLYGYHVHSSTFLVKDSFKFDSLNALKSTFLILYEFLIG